MKNFLIAIIITAALCLTACSETKTPPEANLDVSQEQTTDTQEQKNDSPPVVQRSYRSLTFEELLTEFATDVVTVKYIGQKPFGETKTLVEYEFAVIDRILGSAADRIFVYSSTNTFSDLDALNMPQGFTDSEYLLALSKIIGTSWNTHQDGYGFLRSLVINLDEPSRSIMCDVAIGDIAPLTSENLDFSSKNLSKESIVSYVSELVKDNTPGRVPIRSDKLEDIVEGASNVLILEIGEPYRLDSDSPPTDWAATDVYTVTAVQILKGGFKSEYEFLMVFAAESVKTGEQRLAAVETVVEGGIYMLSHKKGLFEMSQLDEIVKIIESQG